MGLPTEANPEYLQELSELLFGDTGRTYTNPQIE